MGQLTCIGQRKGMIFHTKLILIIRQNMSEPEQKKKKSELTEPLITPITKTHRERV